MLSKPIVVVLNKDEKQIGIAVSEHILTVPDEKNPTGFRFQTLMGVAWDNKRSPALSYHDPSELTWLRLHGDDEFEEEDDSEEADDETTEVVEEAELQQ
ncbi:MAG: hypothetical protein H7836_04530 [Magnetococcus sp. YQC-3]